MNDHANRVADLAPLPRGPHTLSREAVEQSQRNRLLLAATEVIAEKGYAATSVADIVARAGVSRSTFYQLFKDRLDCFLAASEVAQELLIGTMRNQLERLAAERRLAYVERISALIEAYLSSLQKNPAFARVFLVEVYAAGPAAIAQRRKAYDRFIDVFMAARSSAPDPPDVPKEEARAMTEVLVAAVSSFVTNAVGADEIETLPDLHETIMRAVRRLMATAD